MKSENVFKFVSVRPPVRVSPPNEVRLCEFEVSAELVQELTELVSQRIPLEEARLTVGRAIMDAADYYRKDSDWTRLLPFWSKANDVIADARENPSASKFRDEVDEILEQSFGGDMDVDDFLEGPGIGMKRLAWKGYYGNVLAPNDRPEDRDETFGWLIFLELLAATNDDDRFERMMASFALLRLTVPLAFYRPAERTVEVSPSEQPTGPDDLPERIKDLQERIAHLQEARLFIRRRMNFRTRQYKKLVLGPSRAVEPRSGERRSERADAVHRASSPRELITQAPWRLTHDDFSEYPQYLVTLDELGLDPETISGPALMTRIERHVALLNGQALDLTYRQQIASVGKWFSVVTRPGAGYL